MNTRAPCRDTVYTKWAPENFRCRGLSLQIINKVMGLVGSALRIWTKDNLCYNVFSTFSILFFFFNITMCYLYFYVNFN